MSATIITTLSCDRRVSGDHRADIGRCRRKIHLKGTLESARRNAAALGWRASGIGDFCPDHVDPDRRSGAPE